MELLYRRLFLPLFIRRRHWYPAGMKVSLDTTTAAYVIRAYERGRIRINNDHYSNSIILTPGRLITPWAPASIGDLQQAHLTEITTLQPELILLGTGSQLQFPDSALYYYVLQQRIGLEIMDTEAACRTFNILASEGRQVAAGLIINGNSN